MAAKGTASTNSVARSSMASDLQLVKNHAFIGGRWVESASGKTFDVTNPADGLKITTVPDMAAKDCIMAIDAAAEAFPGWSGLMASERAEILSRWAGLIKSHADDIALLMTNEQGKPLEESKGEVLGSAATIQWCAEQGRRLYGQFIDGHKPATKIAISRQPIGVVGAITPWNFPSGMITRKVGPALASGCTVILKPAAATPLCALALAYLAEQAGVPAGVLNIVTSKNAKEIGQTLTDDTRVRKISFTGSTDIGKALMGQASKNLQKVSLELGGNAPFIVFSSADLEKAATGAIASKFRNAGQTCICANRIYVQKDVFAKFMDIFSRKIKDLKVGDGREKGVTIGPLINDKAVEKIETMIEQAKKAGATIHIGGKRHSLGGTFFEPTLITGVADDAMLACEEIFGPVAALYSFDTEDEAVERANNTPFGLAAYMYTQDLSQAMRVSDKLQSGMVGINEPLLASDLAPFGGVKESGIGREGGEYGLLEYTEVKYRLFGI